MEKVLSQDEVNLLLKEMSGIESSLNEDGEPEYDSNEVVPYDLTHPDRVIRGRMPTLELIHDHFARRFRLTLSNYMRRPIGVAGRSTEMVNYQDFIKSIAHPTALGVFRLSPLRGSALLVMERRLAYTFVDLLFGGPGVVEEAKRPPQDFTNIEMRMITKVVQSALEDLEKAWQPVAAIKTRFVRMESHPQFVQIAPPAEIVVVSSFDVEVNRAPMTLSICIPYSMLDSIRSKLNAGYQSENFEVNNSMTKRLSSSVLQSEVDMKIFLGHANLSLKKFLNLKEGDHILLNQASDAPLDILIENVVKFKGIQGAYKGHRAMQITDLVYTAKEDDSWADDL